MTKKQAFSKIDQKIATVDETITVAEEAIKRLRESINIWKQKKKTLQRLRHEVEID